MKSFINSARKFKARVPCRLYFVEVKLLYCNICFKLKKVRVRFKTLKYHYNHAMFVQVET